MEIEIDLQVMRVQGGKLPTWGSMGDAGLDLYSRDYLVVSPNKRRIVKLGIATSFDNRFVALLEDRSGLAAKHGLTVLAGVIDSAYRGEWGCVLYNSGDKPYTVEMGDRICQAIFVQIQHPRIQEVIELPPSGRGESGFGASGK